MEEIKNIIRGGLGRLELPEESTLAFGKGCHQQKSQFDVLLPLGLISQQ